MSEAIDRAVSATSSEPGRPGSLVERVRPDLVLTDIEMPVMDGCALVAELARRHPGLPVIVVSGSDYQERALEARLAGAVDYVRNSRVADELIDALVAHCAGRRPRRG